jgi:fibronectin-binding autotransporter adhesin
LANSLLVKGALLAALLLGLSTNSWAASDNWTGATDNNWNNSVTPNWSGGIPTIGGNQAQFKNNVGNFTINLDGAASASALSFTNAGGGSNVFTFNSGTGGPNTLTIGSNGINNATAQTEIFNANVALNASQTWTSTGGLTFANVNLSNSAANNTLTVAGAGANSITGIIANGGTSTTSGLTYSGTGTLTLSGTNTYGGTTKLSSGTGTVIANNNSAFGTGTLNINVAGSTLKSTTGTTVLGNSVTLGASTTIQDLTFSGIVTQSGGNRTITNNGTSLTFSSTSTVNLSDAVAIRTLTLVGSGATIINGLIQNGPGTGSLAVSSTGSATLSHANTYTGGTTLNAGTLNINNDSALGTGAFTIAGGTIDNTDTPNAHTLTNAQKWNGNFAFTGTNNLTFSTGAVTLGSNLTITANANDLTIGGIIGNGAGNAITKAGAGTLTLSGTNTYTGGTTLSAGTLNINNNSALGTGTLTIAGGTIDNTDTPNAHTLTNAQAWNGNFAFTGTNNLTFSTGAVTLGSNLTITANANDLTIGGIIGNGAGNAITKAGNGTLTLSGANTYTGGTTLNAGTLNINNASALGTGTFTINGGTIGNTSGGAISVNNAQTWGGSFTFNGTNTNPLTFTNNVALTTTPTVTVSDPNGTLTETGIISGAGFGLTKAGAGTLVLSSATGNTYNGGTTINDGTITAGANAAIGTGSLVVNDTTAGGTANFNLNGHNQIVSSLTLGGAGDTATSTNNVTIGAGTLTLGGNVTYDATNNPLGSTISGGTLALGASRTFTVGSSSSSSGSDLTVSSVISGAGFGLTKAGAGTLVLSSATGNTYSGGTTINAGTITAGANAAIGTGGLVVNDTTAGGTANFNLNGHNQTVSSLTLGGAGDTSTSTNNVTLGAGTLTLGGNVTYDATNNPLGSTISGGTLALGAANRTVTVNSSTSSGSNDLTISSAISSTGAFGLIKAGTGNLTLSGANTFTGATTINAGKLTAGAVNVLNTSSGVTVASGATLNLNGFNQAITNLVINGTLASAGTETLTLAGAGNSLGASQTFGGTLDLSSATLSLAGFNLTVGTLEIAAGTSVIDFGSGSSILTVTNLILDSGAALTINNWNDATEYFYTASNPGGALALSHITWGAPYAGDTTKWLSYSDGPGPGRQITPVPEPATYGALFTAATLGLFLWFRLKANAPSLAPVRVAVQY